MTSAKSSPTADTSARELVHSRIFDAPRELVWEAFTNPKHVVNWWGPNGFSTAIETMDVRPGGVWKHVMRGPDGTEYPNKSIFTEVVKPERISYDHGGGTKGGPGANFQATWTFEALGPNQTKLTGRLVFPTADARDTVVKFYNAVEGAKQTLGRLAEFLPKLAAAQASSTAPFVISRTFNAPRELVFKCCSEPEHLKNWHSPKGFQGRSVSMDFKPGGVYHYCLRSPDGHEMWGKCLYREIVPPERLVYINSFSDAQCGTTRHPMSASWPLEMLTVFTFTEKNGQTTLTIQWTPENATDEERRTFDESRAGMTQGWTGSLDQLTAYLATLKS